MWCVYSTVHSRSNQLEWMECLFLLCLRAHKYARAPYAEEFFMRAILCQLKLWMSLAILILGQKKWWFISGYSVGVRHSMTIFGNCLSEWVLGRQLMALRIKVNHSCALSDAFNCSKWYYRLVIGLSAHNLHNISGANNVSQLFFVSQWGAFILSFVSLNNMGINYMIKISRARIQRHRNFSH